jgi:predicted Fe-Mo cluster-binding NifX family protein
VNGEPVKIAFVSDDGLTISDNFKEAKMYIVVYIDNKHAKSREQRQRFWRDSFKARKDNGQGTSIKSHLQSSDGNTCSDFYHLLASIADCDLFLAQRMSSRAYYQVLQVGIRPIVTDLSKIEDALQAVMDGNIIDHKDRLY